MLIGERDVTSRGVIPAVNQERIINVEADVCVASLVESEAATTAQVGACFNVMVALLAASVIATQLRLPLASVCRTLFAVGEGHL